MRPSLHIVRIMKDQAVEFDSAAEAATRSGISETHLYLLMRKGKAHSNGARFIRARDYDGPKVKFTNMSDAAAKPAEDTELQPLTANDMEVLAAGFDVTAAMLEWVQACRSEISDRISANSLDTQMDITHMDNGHIRVAVRVQAPTGAIRHTHLAELTALGWAYSQPWYSTAKRMAWVKAEEFKHPGVAKRG